MKREDKPKDVRCGDIRQAWWCEQRWGKPLLYPLHQATLPLNISAWPQAERQPYRRGYFNKIRAHVGAAALQDE